MRIGTTLTALGLSLVLAVPTLAAPAEDRAALRQQDLDLLYATLEERHPNLFANTAEAVFLNRKAEIESRLDQAEDNAFALDLQSLTALAGDSHTTTSLGSALQGYNMIPAGLGWLDGRWTLSTVDSQYADFLGWELTAVNGVSMDQVCRRLSALISADNEVWLRRQVRQVFGVEDIFVYCGLAQAGEAMVLTVQDADGQSRELTLSLVSSTDRSGWPELAYLSQQRAGSAPTASQDKYYFSMSLDENTYYVQYNACAQDPDLPMDTFVTQVKADLEQGDYTRFLIDLRSNGGGSDGVIVPLLMELAPAVQSGELELWGLIGEATFSSATINAMEILEMGGHLAGEPSGGSVDHFGSVQSFTLPNTGVRVSLSSKFIDIETLMDSGAGLGVTPIQPELTVCQTVADYLAGRDTLVDTLTARTQPFSAPARPDAPLTRGRFAELLRQAAQQTGLETAAQDQAVSDMIPFTWFAPGVNWALSTGVASGLGENTFQPARAVTRQEAAAMLAQAAKLAGKTLPEGEAALSDQDAIAPWALDAARSLTDAGLLDAPEGAFRPQETLTRAQGQALAQWLAQT